MRKVFLWAVFRLLEGFRKIVYGSRGPIGQKLCALAEKAELKAVDVLILRRFRHNGADFRQQLTR